MKNAPSFFWPLVLSAFALMLGAVPMSVYAQNLAIQPAARDRIAADCRRQHPNLVFDYVSRQACIDENERIERGRLRQEQEAEDRRVREERAAEERRRREEAVRPCIAAALPSMEEKLATIKTRVNHNMTLDQIKEDLDKFFPTTGEIVFSQRDIFQRVYVNYLPPPCATNFGFLVNVSADRDGNLLRLGVWSQNPPVGYPDDFRADFSRNLTQERLDERERASRIIAEVQERQRQLTLIEQDRRRLAELQRRSEAVRSQLLITSRNTECFSQINCDGYRVIVSVRNNSSEIVRGIRFGFSIIPEGESCPANLSPRVSRQFTLQPGETGTFRWMGSETGMPPAPPTRSIRFCVTVAGVDLS